MGDIEADTRHNARMAEWQHMREQGIGWEEMPAVLGITRAAWVHTYERALKEGDKRAVGRPDYTTDTDRRAGKNSAGDESALTPMASQGTGVRSGRLVMPGTHNRRRRGR